MAGEPMTGQALFVLTAEAHGGRLRGGLERRYRRVLRPRQIPRRPLSVLASALAAAGLMLTVASCSHITPLGPDRTPPNLPPARDLASPIIVQVMRSQPPAPTGRCPADSVSLFGLEPNVLRAAAAPPVPAQPVQGSTATPGPAAAPPVGVACYLPVGRPVTITSAAVSPVATYPPPPGVPNAPASYGFVVAFPVADVSALTADIRRAYASGDAVGISVAGKLWQAPQVRRRFIALRAEQILLLSRKQAFQLHRLLVRSD